MENQSEKPGFVMNDFHKQSIKACCAAVGRMQSHPLTREEKIAQIKRVHEQSLARRNKNEKG